MLSLIARQLSLETSTVTRQLESSLWKLQRSLWCLYCFLSGLKCSLSSLNAPMAVLPLTFRSFPRSFVARGRRWMLLCVRRRNQQRATRVCLRLASPEGNSTAQDWHNVAERIAHVNEEGTCTHDEDATALRAREGRIVAVQFLVFSVRIKFALHPRSPSFSGTLWHPEKKKAQGVTP